MSIGTIDTCRVSGKSSTYVGGSEPWRECDKDGWVQHDGKGVPDFGECEWFEIRLRSGAAAGGLIAKNAGLRWEITGGPGDITHWRPIRREAEAPRQTPKAEPQFKVGDWVRLRAGIEEVTVRARGYTEGCVRRLLARHGQRVVSISHSADGTSLYDKASALTCFVGTEWLELAEEPKAEEPASPENDRLQDQTEAMQARDDRPESERERAYRLRMREKASKPYAAALKAKTARYERMEVEAPSLLRVATPTHRLGGQFTGVEQ